ncbi:MAG: LapA family protein [Miltoncostaeaceae bacterium]
MEIEEQHGSEQPKAAKGHSAVSIIAIIVVTAVVVAWIMLNRGDVEVEWLVTSSQAPLSVVIVIAAVLGWVGGSLTMFIIRRRRRK